MAEVRWTRFKWEINKVTEGEVVSSSVHANDSLRYHACVVIRRRLQTTAKPLVNRRSIVITNFLTSTSVLSSPLSGWDLAPDENEEIYETSEIDVIPVESIISNLTGLKFKISGFYESFTKRIIPLPEEEGRADEFKRSIKYSEILKGKGVKEATLATFEDGEEGGEELLEGEEGKLRKCLRLLSLSEENKSKLEERKEEKGKKTDADASHVQIGDTYSFPMCKSLTHRLR